MNITENNKLIAEFIGVFDKILSIGNIHSWSDAPFYYTTEDTKEKVIKNISKYSKYHSDWNWLMRVVEKIENTKTQNLSFNFNIQKDRVSLYYTHTSEPKKQIEMWFEWGQKTKIENTYKIVVEFIKWYNEQNK